MINKILKGKIITAFGTQADFSQAVGLDETLISRIVNGRRRLSADEQKRWASILGCDSDEIFKERSA